MNKLKYKIGFLIFILIIQNIFTINAFASQIASIPGVVAETAVLIEARTGKVIYAKEAHKRIYPASMTKILTAIVAMEYFTLDEMIVTGGKDVLNIPNDSSKAGHLEGEVISFHNLLRALMISSGNETGNVIAYAVAKRATGNDDITYAVAERYFCELMNQKAVELGALNSNFVNPHGYHHDNMYSTAYDIAIISRYAMENDIFREIVAETSFSGNGAGNNPDPSWTTKNYNFETHNELIMNGAYYYPYATGIKTGRTSRAGDCVAASATKDGVSLIAVICKSVDPSRWTDAITLFNYGFDNFSFQVLQEPGDVVGEVALEKPRLGESPFLEYFGIDYVESYIGKNDIDRIVKDVSFDPAYVSIAYPEDKKTGVIDNSLKLIAPIQEGEVIGKIAYSLDGEVLFAGDIVASRAVLEKSFNSDIDYYLDVIKEAALSKEAIPYWISGVLFIIILIDIIGRVVRRKKSSFYRRYR